MTQKGPPWGWALAGLGLLACAILACGKAPTEGPTRAPTNADNRTRRVTPAVWAGAPADDPPPLDDGLWHALKEGDVVKVDDVGQARVVLKGCDGSLYVFRNTVIQAKPCRKEEHESGSVFCALQGTPWFNIECTDYFVVDTDAGHVRVGRATFSASYEPDRQLLLVVVLDGSVDVQPVIDADAHELSQQSIRVAAQQFLYTMPGIESPQLQGLPARIPLNLEQLPTLTKELQISPWPPPPSSEISAWVSAPNPDPRSEQTVFGKLVINGVGVAGAQMYCVVHYKTETTDSRFAEDGSPRPTVLTNRDGVASTTFRISRAISEYPVRVDVYIIFAGQTYSTVTSFTPK